MTACLKYSQHCNLICWWLQRWLWSSSHCTATLQVTSQYLWLMCAERCLHEFEHSAWQWLSAKLPTSIVMGWESADTPCCCMTLALSCQWLELQDEHAGRCSQHWANTYCECMHYIDQHDCTAPHSQVVPCSCQKLQWDSFKVSSVAGNGSRWKLSMLTVNINCDIAASMHCQSLQLQGIQNDCQPMCWTQQELSVANRWACWLSFNEWQQQVL